MQATRFSRYVWAESSDGWSTHSSVTELDTETDTYKTVLTKCSKPSYVWIKISEGLWIRTRETADRVVPAKEYYLPDEIWQHIIGMNTYLGYKALHATRCCSQRKTHRFLLHANSYYTLHATRCFSFR